MNILILVSQIILISGGRTERSVPTNMTGVTISAYIHPYVRSCPPASMLSKTDFDIANHCYQPWGRPRKRCSNKRDDECKHNTPTHSTLNAIKQITQQRPLKLMIPLFSYQGPPTLSQNFKTPWVSPEPQRQELGFMGVRDAKNVCHLSCVSDPPQGFQCPKCGRVVPHASDSTATSELEPARSRQTILHDPCKRGRS